MAGKGGRNIKYTAQEDPSFIKQFKERIGYKEDPKLEAKVCSGVYSFWFTRTHLATQAPWVDCSVALFPNILSRRKLYWA
jgi:hypothetical protein